MLIFGRKVPQQPRNLSLWSFCNKLRSVVEFITLQAPGGEAYIPRELDAFSKVQTTVQLLVYHKQAPAAHLSGEEAIAEYIGGVANGPHQWHMVAKTVREKYTSWEGILRMLLALRNETDYKNLIWDSEVWYAIRRAVVDSDYKRATTHETWNQLVGIVANTADADDALGRKHALFVAVKRFERGAWTQTLP